MVGLVSCEFLYSFVSFCFCGTQVLKQNLHYEPVKAEGDLVNTSKPPHFCVICHSVTVPYQISLFKFPKDPKV